MPDTPRSCAVPRPPPCWDPCRARLPGAGGSARYPPGHPELVLAGTGDSAPESAPATHGLRRVAPPGGRPTRPTAARPADSTRGPAASSPAGGAVGRLDVPPLPPHGLGR